MDVYVACGFHVLAIVQIVLQWTLECYLRIFEQTLCSYHSNSKVSKGYEDEKNLFQPTNDIKILWIPL